MRPLIALCLAAPLLLGCGHLPAEVAYTGTTVVPTTTTTEPPLLLPPPTTSTTAAPPPRVHAAAASAPTPAVVGDVWAALRRCESGGNYQANTGNGFFGAYQFTASTWRSMGTGYARADLAPPAVQDDAARRLQARSGWGQWPACSRKLGLR